jgi:hypothetical protein
MILISTLSWIRAHGRMLFQRASGCGKCNCQLPDWRWRVRGLIVSIIASCISCGGHKECHVLLIVPNGTKFLRIKCDNANIRASHSYVYNDVMIVVFDSDGTAVVRDRALLNEWCTQHAIYTDGTEIKIGSNESPDDVSLRSVGTTPERINYYVIGTLKDKMAMWQSHGNYWETKK